ncbi:MAG: endonuclease VIII, partial [Anaerolineae bacterium]|nr:endonuclease VIII [Anaerolineae bacterium]
GWGAAMLFHDSEVPDHPWVGKPGVSPLSDAFTYEYFEGRFGELKENDPSSVKFFVISKPGVWGVGNGCLQDILFRARIHPRRRALDLREGERRALHAALRDTLGQMVAQGGRDGEIDLYGQPGGYQRILSSETAGKPCPECGTPIEKISYLGGASYFCPKCQV